MKLKKRTVKQRISTFIVMIMLLGFSAVYCQTDTEIVPAKADPETEEVIGEAVATIEAGAAGAVIEEPDVTADMPTVILRIDCEDGKILSDDMEFFVTIENESNGELEGKFDWIPKGEELTIHFDSSDGAVHSERFENNEMTVVPTEGVTKKLTFTHVRTGKYHKTPLIDGKIYISFIVGKESGKVSVKCQQNNDKGIFYKEAKPDGVLLVGVIYYHLDTIDIIPKFGGMSFYDDMSYKLSAGGGDDFTWKPGSCTLYVSEKPEDSVIKDISPDGTMCVLPQQHEITIEEMTHPDNVRNAGKATFTIGGDGKITSVTDKSSYTGKGTAELIVDHISSNYVDLNVLDKLNPERVIKDGVLTFKSEYSTDDSTDWRYGDKVDILAGDYITTEKNGDTNIIKIPTSTEGKKIAITLKEKSAPASCISLGTSELVFTANDEGTITAEGNVPDAFDIIVPRGGSNARINVKYARRLGISLEAAGDTSHDNIPMQTTVTVSDDLGNSSGKVPVIKAYGIMDNRLAEDSKFTFTDGSGTVTTYTYPVTLTFSDTKAYTGSGSTAVFTAATSYNTVKGKVVKIAPDGSVSLSKGTWAKSGAGYYYDETENIIRIAHTKTSDESGEDDERIKVRLYPADDDGESPDTDEKPLTGWTYKIREYTGSLKSLSSLADNSTESSLSNTDKWGKFRDLEPSSGGSLYYIDDDILADGHFYQLKETKTPSGYETDDDGVIFEYDAGVGIKDGVYGQGERQKAGSSSNSAYTYDTLNLYNLKEGSGGRGGRDYIFVNKFAVGGNTMLSNANFELYEGNAPARTTQGRNQTGSTSTPASSGGTRIKSWTSSATSADQNRIKVSDLKKNTTYTIRETMAPVGYSTPTVDWQFQINSDGWAVATGTASNLFTIGSQNNTITIYNQTSENSGGVVKTPDRRKLAFWLDVVVVALGGLYLSGFSVFEYLPRTKPDDKAQKA